MRIAMLSADANPLAARRAHVAQLCRALARQGHDVTVYTRRDDGRTPAEVTSPDGYRVLSVPAGRRAHLSDQELLPLTSRFADVLRTRWEAERPQLVHAHGWLPGLAAVPATEGTSIPVVQSFPTLGAVESRFKDAGATVPPDRRRAEQLVMKRADRVIASCSDEVFELIRLGTAKSRVSVVPSGVDVEVFDPAGPKAPRTVRHRIVSSGHLVPRSGFDTAVVALKALPDTELVIAGGPGNARTGPEARRLRTLANDLGVRDRLQFAGDLADGDLAALLRSADVVTCTPWHDTAGAGPLKAMACGVPVVADAVGGLSDTVIDGVTGTLVPARDPRRLAKALRELLGDPISRDRYGLAGYDRVHARYSWDRVAGETVRAYEQVLPVAEEMGATVR